jgi:hypothetical protein
MATGNGASDSAPVNFSLRDEFGQQAGLNFLEPLLGRRRPGRAMLAGHQLVW